MTGRARGKTRGDDRTRGRRAHGLDAEIYLTEVIKRLPHFATAEQAAELTPSRFAAALRAREQEVA